MFVTYRVSAGWADGERMELLLVSLSVLLPAPLLRAPLGHSLAGSSRTWKRVGEMTEQGQKAITTRLSLQEALRSMGAEWKRCLSTENCPPPFFHCTVFHKSWRNCPVPYFKLLFEAVSFRKALCIWLSCPPSLAWSRWIVWLFGWVSHSWDLLRASVPRETKQDCLCSWKLRSICRIDIAWCCAVKERWFGMDSQ